MSLSLYYFLSITAIYILMSWCIYLPYRVAHLHFKVIANMAISGYLAGFLVKTMGFPFGFALILGFIVGALLGFAVAQFIGDAPTFAVVIVGFTFIYITRTVIENMKIIGGTMGMFGLPAVFGSGTAHRWAILIILYLLVILVGALIHRFENSRLGRAASAIFVDKELATAFGINVKSVGILLQTFSSMVAGGCGVLYGFIYRSFHLDYFTFHLIGIFMAIIFVGGYMTMWGTIIAAPILYGGPLLFPEAVQKWRIVIYGVLLLVVLTLKPEGFITRKFVTTIGRKISFGKKKSKIVKT